MFPALGMPEMLVIMLVILLVFGSKRLPEFARNLGKALHELKKSAEEIKREMDIDDKK
ncbi:twin-arginine translocase TatA/TatE family subunit [candidate division KSB1 bacterium]|nr:twin-arginine translocase TatA/TatE family subunit [candidate division KSB1 bacterium]